MSLGIEERRLGWAYGLLLLLLTGLAYSPTLGFGFVWDDYPLILENEVLKAPDAVRQIFFRNFWDVGGRNDTFRHFYRPMVTLSYWADARLGGMQAAWFHATNVALHLGCCAWAFVLARDLLRSSAAAFAAGAFFALHPTHVENVAWISGRTDLVAGFFGLAALGVWRKAERADGRAVWVWLALGAGLYFLALLGKEVAVFFPLAWLCFPRPGPGAAAWPWWSLGRVRAWGMGAAGLAALAYFSLRWQALDVLASNVSFPGWVSYLPALGWVLFSYLRLAVTGLLLAPHYSDIQFKFMQGGTAAAGWALLVALGLAAVWVLRRGGLPARALVLALLFLAPVFSLGSFGDVLYADRFLYLPSLGLGVMAAWALQRVWARFPPPPAWRTYGVFLTAGLASLAALGMVVRTSQAWRDNVGLFERAALTSPKSVLIWNNLGLAYTYEGRYAEAELALRKGLDVQPGHGYSLHNLGVAVRRQGRVEEAIGYYEQAMAQDPWDSLYAYNAAEAYAFLGQDARAEQLYRRVLRVRPGHHEARHNLGYLLMQQGRLEEARPLLEEAAAGAAKPARALNSLGILEARQGRLDQARLYFEAALKAEPDLRAAQDNLHRLGKEGP